MYPAFSVIIFTVFSGLGYGIVAILGTGIVSYQSSHITIAYLIATALIIGGLLSSTLHLGHPERAWRAFTQWRSSWLSREGVLAILTFIPLGVLLLILIFEKVSLWPYMVQYLALSAGGLSLITVFSTSMIYTSLHAIPAWHNWLTPICYLLFAISGGLLAMCHLTSYTGSVNIGHVISFTIVANLVTITWLLKVFWWMRMDRNTGDITTAKATGLGSFGLVRLLERPHVTENYLTNEMGFQIGRKHARKIRWLAILIGAIIPISIILLTPRFAQNYMTLLTMVAFMSYSVGLLLERWLFFAEARHCVTAYYDSERSS